MASELSYSANMLQPYQELVQTRGRSAKAFCCSCSYQFSVAVVLWATLSEGQFSADSSKALSLTDRGGGGGGLPYLTTETSIFNLACTVEFHNYICIYIYIYFKGQRMLETNH